MSTASQAGMPTPMQPLDIQNPDNQALLFSSAGGQSNGNTMRTRYTPVRFAVICLIDSIQREHAALMASMHYDECANERMREEIEANQIRPVY